MDALLAHTFDGVEDLRCQWQHAEVASSCGCGCGSIGFAVPGTSQPDPASGTDFVPVEAVIVDDAGESIGGAFVLTCEGVLYDVDVYSFTAEPLPIPLLDSVRWIRK